jgi:hypothetical protein
LNLSPYELVLIAGGLTVIGALVGGWIGYKNALSIYNITEFNKAAYELRNAFIVQLNLLKYNVNSGSGDTSNIGEYLRAHYVSNHLKAFETFKCCLTPREIESIDKAWGEYCNFKQYSDKNNQEAMRKLALKNLEGVLEFAKHK